MEHGSRNFLEFSDSFEGMQGVIQLEPSKNQGNPQTNSAAPVPSKTFLDPYKGYCEVDTDIVFQRLKKTLWPFDRRKFFENKGDLYGAFWVPTTLIFIMSVAGSFANKIASNEGYTFDPKGIVITASTVYFFIFAVPALLYFVLFTGIDIAYYDIMSLYGYSYFTFWPAAIVSVVNFSPLRWVAFATASVWSGLLVSKNYYNEVQILEEWKKYATAVFSFSGYVALTLIANFYLYE